MNLDAIKAGLTDAWASVAAFTPKLVAALVILLVGYLVAKVVRTIVTRVLTTVRFDDVLHRAGVETASEKSGYDAKGLIAGIVGWTVMFVTLQLAAETLGATQFALLLTGLIAYLPLVLVAVAIVVVALAFASFVSGAIDANVGERGHVGARIAYWSIVGFGAFAALNQLNVAEEIVNALFYAIVGSAAVTAVIAFGVGGIPVARQVTAKWAHKVDPTVRLRDVA